MITSDEKGELLDAVLLFLLNRVATHVATFHIRSHVPCAGAQGY
jgi:hypothetical protein